MNITRKDDLVILVADADMEQGLSSLVKRYQAIGIRLISHKIIVHPQRDPGIVKRAEELLRIYPNQFEYALVVFDLKGCGRESQEPQSIIDDLQGRLDRTGWKNRSRVIMIEPELEAWVWSDSPQVDEALGWSGQNLRQWLKDKGYVQRGGQKPLRPKETMDVALRIARQPRSSSIYKTLGQRVSFTSCADPAFRLLLKTLRQWFPAQEEEIPP